MRAIAFYYERDYDRAWEDLRKAESLGWKISPNFLQNLQKASGRDK